MSDTFDPTEDDKNQPTEEELAAIRDKAEELKQAAQKIGLYLQGYRIGTVDDVDGGTRMVIVADFLPGEVAFSTRVLDPETANFDEEFHGIQVDTEADEVKAYRQRLLDEGLASERPDEAT